MKLFGERQEQDKGWRLAIIRDIPKSGGVYLIECTATGSKYVGAAVNLKRRICDHLNNMSISDHHHSSFKGEYLDHGKETFRVEILEHINDRSKLAEREAYWHQKMSDDLCNVDPAKKHRSW